ncbi:MAG: gliding motility-associated C-terminal domain-containing protein [Saprospiraceae bacterium]|nr:MAG: gliding motility-associated C-terminal domain-containing protein [Saprospiraceae bacterium]
MRSFFLFTTILTGIFIPHDSLCQGTSYQITIDSSNYKLGDMLVNENSEYVGVFFGPPPNLWSPELFLVDFSGNDISTKPAYRFFTGGNATFRWLIRGHSKGKRVIIYAFMEFTNPAIISIDMSTGSYWVKSAGWSRTDFAFDETSNNLAIFGGNGINARLSILDSAGMEEWTRDYTINSTGFPSPISDKAIIQFHPVFGYYGSVTLYDSDNPSLTESFILHLGQDGLPLQWKNFDSFQLKELYTGYDGLYLLGKTDAEFSFTNNTSNLMLVKMDWNLNVQWARVYHASSFEYNKATLSTANDGTLTLGYSTFGAFPVILAKLDAQGNILWQKGYPLFEPQIDAMPDGSLLLAAANHFDSTGAIFPKIIIAKTDSIGNIEGCQSFPTCLKTNTVSFSVNDFELENEPGSLDTILPPNFFVEPTQFTFSDFCDIPPAPSPEFSIPDTICAMDSITTLAPANVNAHGTLWHLTGNDVDSIWADSLTFRYRFHKPGSYTLSQTVWFLGCGHSAQHTIEVVPALEAAIVADAKPCEPPLRLKIESNKPLKEILWNTGDTAASIEALQDGTYAVSVSDGYCQAGDTTQIAFASTLLGGQPALTLPSDTTICLQDLPFALLPLSPFTDSFLLNFNPTGQLPFSLEEGSTYIVSAVIEGCLFNETFHLKLKDCNPAVYLPNAFSPNGDGINDSFFPQGKNFIPSKLLIFDRWGGMIHSSEGLSANWDGGNAPAGVYVYVFEFLDSRTHEKKRTEGEVTLVR